MNNLKQALWYAEQGLPVFPCRDKKPLCKHGFKSATTNPATIKKWWKHWRNANIATPVGPEYQFVVVDIDVGGDKKGWESLAAFEEKYGKLPETMTVETQSGGEHRYFRCKDDVPRAINGLGENVDFLTNGYVLLPGSKGYSWKNQGLIADLPKNVITVLRSDVFGGKETESYKAVDSSQNTPETKANINPIDNISLLLGSRRCGGMSFDFLQELYSTEWVNQRVANYLGLPNNFVSQTDSIQSILPGHEDRNPSTQLTKREDGWWHYLDYSKHFGRFRYNLPQLYATIRYKQNQNLSSSEWMTWAFKLLVDAEVVRIPKISKARTDKGTNSTCERVLQGFIQLMSLKSFVPTFDGKTAFSKTFAAAWCGVSEAAAHRAKCWLMEQNYMAMVDVHKNRYGNTCGLFKLGTTMAKIKADEAKYGTANDPTAAYQRDGDCGHGEEAELHGRSPVQRSLSTVQAVSECEAGQISRNHVDGYEEKPEEVPDSGRGCEKVTGTLHGGEQLEEGEDGRQGMGPVGAVYWEDEDIYWEGFTFDVPQWKNLSGEYY